VRFEPLGKDVRVRPGTHRGFIIGMLCSSFITVGAAAMHAGHPWGGLTFALPGLCLGVLVLVTPERGEPPR
jgi:hypothetical protein